MRKGRRTRSRRSRRPRIRRPRTRRQKQMYKTARAGSRSKILPQMGTLTVAPTVGFKIEPQYLFVRALAFCDPWLQLADEPKIDNLFCCIFGQ